MIQRHPILGGGADAMPVRKQFFLKMGQNGFEEFEYDSAIEQLDRSFKRMEDALNGTDWLVGGQYAMADMWVGRYPLVSRWFERMTARPAVQIAIPPEARLTQPAPAAWSNLICDQKCTTFEGVIEFDLPSQGYFVNREMIMMKSFNFRVIGAVAAIGMVFAASSASAETIRLTMASGAPPVDPIFKFVKGAFFKTVAAELKAAGGNHTVKWTPAFGGSVAKLGGVLEAVQSGLADVGLLVFVFEAASLPLHNAGVFTPFAATDNRLVATAFHDLHKTVPAMNTYWAKRDQVYLGNYNLDSYQILTQFPINKLSDLKGRKIGGVGPNLTWLKGTGAVGVATTGPQIYNALKTGLYNGILLPISLLRAFRLYEVAKHLTIVDFGAINGGAITINKKRWDKLPAAVQKALKKGGDAFRADAILERANTLKGALKVLTDNGVTVNRLSAADRSKWAANIPDLAKIWSKGDPDKKAVIKALMASYRAGGAKMARNWDNLPSDGTGQPAGRPASTPVEDDRY